MKDAKIAKYMKKLARAAHKELNSVPVGVPLEDPEIIDVCDWLQLFASAKFMFKWHTTRDRWHEVDDLEVTLIEEVDRFTL